MTTAKVPLSATPTQITDGSVTAFITCNQLFFFADSPVAPTDLTACHTDTKLSVNPPFQIWAWSAAPGAVLTVTSQIA